MPRGDFREASKGGAGFQEGYVHITRSVSRVFQFPKNQSTGEQSEPFTALVWEGTLLTPEWKPQDIEDNTFEIILRMGDLEKMRPGKLDPKDFDNLSVEPQDMGSTVGAEGNTFYLEAGAKFGAAWAYMQESLQKCGFKPEILGRCVASDFEGLIAHFKQEAGKPYIAQKGPKKGTEVKPSNLVCDRIQPPYPYEKGAIKGPMAGTHGKGAAKGGTTEAAGAASGKSNGGATEQPAATAGDIDAATDVAAMFANGFSAKFVAEVPLGQAVKRATFQKSITYELLRMKLKPDVQKAYMDFIKSDDFVALGAATELFKVEGDNITIAPAAA